MGPCTCERPQKSGHPSTVNGSKLVVVHGYGRGSETLESRVPPALGVSVYDRIVFTPQGTNVSRRSSLKPGVGTSTLGKTFSSYESRCRRVVGLPSRVARSPGAWLPPLRKDGGDDYPRVLVPKGYTEGDRSDTRSEVSVVVRGASRRSGRIERPYLSFFHFVVVVSGRSEAELVGGSVTDTPPDLAVPGGRYLTPVEPDLFIDTT